jgi:hypothetical protein
MSSRRICFKARLLRPASNGRAVSWSFLVLPQSASARLPTRAMTSVEGTLNGVPFRAPLQPDGRKSHWLKVTRRLRESAGAAMGDTVQLEISPAARRDWILWIVSARQAQSRARRIANACDMLSSGKRRVCCFDRSGFYSKGFSAPVAAS